VPASQIDARRSVTRRRVTSLCPSSDLPTKIASLCTTLALPVSIDSGKCEGLYVCLRDSSLNGACVLDLIKSLLDAVNKLSEDVTQLKSGL
jgi:hypothetical protein